LATSSHFDRLVFERRHEQAMALYIGGEMIDAALDLGSSIRVPIAKGFGSWPHTKITKPELLQLVS
jgi:hypothetical protein